jgi:hypothetical protein
MRRILALAALLLAATTACKGNNEFLPSGYYSGSTPDKQAVNVVVGGSITLDGVEMRFGRDKWMYAVHDKQLRMRCHTQNKQTELSCLIDRHGRQETDELLKL